MALTLDEQDELEAALFEAAQLHRTLVQETAAARARRDELVVRLLDESGCSQVGAAELAGISRAAVHRILAADVGDASDDWE